MRLHIIYTEAGVLLSKRQYSSWRAIQDEYPGYKASLGPWTPEEVTDYLSQEYSDLSSSASEQVGAFLAQPGEVAAVAFRGQRPA